MRKIIFYVLTLLFLVVGTIAVVLYGKGYNFSFGDGKIGIAGTGLLAATSLPDGAGIYINDHLTSATNNTINLAPGVYDIKIIKSGYFPWKKTIVIEKEVVSTVYALLLPAAPKLDNITNAGVSNPVIDPSRTKIAYTASSYEDPRKNGIYILDMSLRPILTLQSSSIQIANETIDNLSESSLLWSPDAKELIATVSAGRSAPTTYLLKTSFNENPQDITETLPATQALWAKQEEQQNKSQLFGLKAKLQNIISENFKILSWSEDESKILYTATQSAELPLLINPPMIGTNSTPQERTIKKDLLYVYDIKEDRNYEIGNSQGSKSLSWFPDSKHLIYVADKRIGIMDYDGLNRTTVYAGPFVDNYVFPWPDGSKILILTDLGNPSISPNLYTIGLK